MSTDDPERPPVVLLSYSHDDPDHVRRVLELAQRMRREGIDSVIDQFDDATAEGWPRWMLRQIREADFTRSARASCREARAAGSSGSRT